MFFVHVSSKRATHLGAIPGLAGHQGQVPRLRQAERVWRFLDEAEDSGGVREIFGEGACDAFLIIDVC